MDITHDNVCSSMLSCFYSHLLSTGRPISSFPGIMSTDNLKCHLYMFKALFGLFFLEDLKFC